MKINTKKGFSLVELLVVIVIIGILSGMGIAQFQSQQKKAKRAKRIAERAQVCKQMVATCAETQNLNCQSYTDCVNTFPVAFRATDSLILPLNASAVKRVTFEIKIDDTNVVLFRNFGPNYAYFFAAHTGNGFYGNNSGGYQVFVDGNQVTDLRPFFNDGIMHSIEIRNLNLPIWNQIHVNGYGNGSGYNLNGELSNLKFFDENNALLAAYSFSEGSGVSVADSSGNGHDGTLTTADETVFWGE